MAWSPEQLSNAKVIIQVGRQLGASDRDITIALMAGWQESGLRNLNYGDRDSIGIFQQRNPWGSRSARLDPAQSAKMFYTGGVGGQRGLFDFKNRDSYGLGQAAQKVQVSAFPDRYDQWQDESVALLKELGGSTVHPGVSTGPTDPTTSDPIVAGPVEPPTPFTALGVGAATTDGLQAAGLAATGTPGLESADKQPQFAQPDLGGLLQDVQAQSGSDIPSSSSGGFGGTPGKQGNYSLPGVKPYVLTAANELGGMFGIKSIGGVGNRPNASDHPGGKAIDLMTRTGGQLAAFAMANAKRLNIKYIIWNQHIWSVGHANQGWRMMEDRGGDTANHKDHVHISFN